MNYQNSFEIVCAGKEDGAELSRFFGNYSFEGKIAIAYLRDPDLIESYSREGDQSVIMTVRDKRQGGNIIGTGCCIIKRGFVGGKPARLGYLTGLKLLPEYRKKLSFIPLVYRELYEQTKDKVDVYYTTILEENKTVWEMLEKKRKFMPEYRFLGNIHTYFCKTGGRGGRKSDSCRFAVCSREAAAEFYRRTFVKCNFSVEDALQNDLANASFYGLWKNEELAAVGYVLDQRSYKQYVVHHYGGIYKLISRLPVSLLGYPGFPKAGKTANCASAGIWCRGGKKGESVEEMIGMLWNGICRESERFDFLILAFHQSHIGAGVLSKMKNIEYVSRFYQVLWDAGCQVSLKEEMPEPGEQQVQVEVAFL